MSNLLRPWLALVAVAILLGLALRLACLGAEFWLDEIWSWELAHSARTAADVFSIRHDNNHVLNSLWLHCWPATSSFAWLRLHSLLAGVATVPLAAFVARRGGAAAAVFAAFAVAGCSWLVFASAEARGYALAICFAFAALEALWRYLDRRDWRAALLFWLFSMLGFLAHLTFVHAYIGFVLWSMRRFATPQGELAQKPSSMGQMGQLFLCHGPVGAFFLAYYVLTIRGMEVGGGPPADTTAVLGSLFGRGLGGPGDGLGCWILVGLGAALFVVGLRHIAGAHGDVWTFFAAAAVGSPALFLIRRPPFLFERYFLVSFAFFLLVLAFALAALWQRRAWLPVCAALLVAFLAGNGRQVREFAANGRGEFQKALAWIDMHSPETIIVIAGDHPFRVEKYFDFYSQRWNGEYFYSDEHNNWLLVHRTDDDPRPEPGEVEHFRGRAFNLVWAFPARGRPAWGWYVYHIDVWER